MSKNTTFAAIIVAAGRGERAGSPQDGPKQYRLIGGRPILAWTLELFLHHPGIGRVVVVIHPDDRGLFEALEENICTAPILSLVYGGNDRQASVMNGLAALGADKPDFVLIHDGVRPFCDSDLLDRVMTSLNPDTQAVFPALPVTDTLKQSSDGLSVGKTVPRTHLYGAQTPQGFAYEAIFDAHKRASRNAQTSFTDDCSIAEWAGMNVRLVPGDIDNIKLTTARDIKLANEKLTIHSALPDVRTGNGYDVHALVDGDHVTLCGIDIEHDQSLDGHSDADVALHALTDALLATCGEGDIGDHFPPTDPQWKGAASHIFLEHAAALVRTRGGTLLNVDVTLICEAPKIGPHRLAMRKKLADMLNIDLQRCSVKATTNEKIGFIGRQEGIACIATASVFYGYSQP